MKLAALVSVFPKEDKHKIYIFVRNKARISLRTLSWYNVLCMWCSAPMQHSHFPSRFVQCLSKLVRLLSIHCWLNVMRHSDTCNILDYDLTHDPYTPVVHATVLICMYLPDWFECFGFALCPSRFVQCHSIYVSVSTVHPLFTKKWHIQKRFIIIMLLFDLLYLKFEH